MDMVTGSDAGAYSYNYGYGGPTAYAGYGWGGYSGPGYYSPSYTYGATYSRSYAYGSPYYRSYGLVRRSGAGMYARARTTTVERSYALASRSHLQQYAQSRAPLHRVSAAATGHLTRKVADLQRPSVVRAANIKGAPALRTVTVAPAAKAKPSIHSASASEGAYR